MPEGYCPGIPSQDADNIKLVTHKILDKLENKYECKFDEKIITAIIFWIFINHNRSFDIE